MTIFKKILGEEVVLSDDVLRLKYYYDNNFPVVLILTDDNSEQDTSFLRFALTMDLVNDNSEELERYLERVVLRFLNKPVTIAGNQLITIRELQMTDLLDVMEIYSDSKGQIEAFYDNENEAESYLRDYIESQYDVFEYGIWGITLAEKAQEVKVEDKEAEIIGLVGVSEKVNGPELMYGLKKKYRGRGYGYEAACLALDFVFENELCENVSITVSKDNDKSLCLAGRLEKKYKPRVKTEVIN